MRYIWTPGEGPDLSAVQRLTRHFPKPSHPMGEAWFMGGKRRMYDSLCGDLAAVPLSELFNALDEIGSGTLCFGAFEESNEWYHYLLAHLVLRANEINAFDRLSEVLVSSFMALYPGSVIEAKYPQFRDDIFATLGRALMSADLWNGDQIVLGKALHRHRNPKTGIWGWYDASADLSALMFFHLKYLSETDLRSWLKSVLSIHSAHWRSQIIVWFVGARELLFDPDAFPDDLGLKKSPQVGWASCHWLSKRLLADDLPKAPSNQFIPPPNRAEALSVVSEYFSESVFLEWLTSMGSVEYLEAEASDYLFEFWEQYGAKHP